MRLSVATKLVPLLIFACRCAYGSDLRVPADFATIQSAIDAAVNGDRVLVVSNSYTENLLISGKNLELRVEPATATVTVHGATATNTLRIDSGASVKIQNFTFFYGDASRMGYPLIMSKDAKQIEMDGCSVLGPIFTPEPLSRQYGGEIGGSFTSSTLVSLSSCRFRGGRGGDGLTSDFLGTPGGDGGSGILLRNCESALLTEVQATGGNGGSGGTRIFPYERAVGGDGGDGVVADHSNILAQDVEAFGGFGGSGSSVGANGEPYVLLNGATWSDVTPPKATHGWMLE